MRWALIWPGSIVRRARPASIAAAMSFKPMTGLVDKIGGRPTWAEIDLDALAGNLRAIRERVGREVKVMAAVKADAYGHGALRCARRLQAEGVEWFGVALPEEGIALRGGGVTKPILCLGGFWEGQQEA